MASSRNAFLTVAVFSVLLLGNCAEAGLLGNVILATTAGVVTFVGAPIVLGAAGFTAAGITAGSTAASMMSASAVSSGGGVVAGGVVATLQSIGAAGLSAKTAAVVGTGAGAIMRAIGK